MRRHEIKGQRLSRYRTEGAMRLKDNGSLVIQRKVPSTAISSSPIHEKRTPGRSVIVSTMSSLKLAADCHKMTGDSAARGQLLGVRDRVRVVERTRPQLVQVPVGRE